MSNRTTNLGLFKWDLTNQTDLESQFDIETSMNENWDKIDENAETKQEQIEMLQEENEDLKERINDAENNELKGTVSGTSISITDSADSRVKSIGLSGNSIQNGTPTISNSVEIESCGDNENLYNENITPTHYYYNAQGVRDENPARTFINQTINNLQKKSLVISYSKKVGTDTYVRINEYNTSGTFIKRTLINTTPYSLTLDTNTSYIIVCVDSDTNYYFGKLKIEYGSTATIWSPYGKTITEYFVNRNLFEDIKEENNKVLSTTGDYNTTDGYAIYKKIKINKNTNYNISFKYLGTEDHSIRIGLYDNEDNFISRLLTTTTNYTFNSSNTTYIRLSYAYNICYDVQIEKSSTSSEYEEQKKQTFIIPCQQPMRAIDNTRDIFVKVNGVWYERHNILRKTFDGTESWTRGTINASNQQYTFYVTRPSNAIPAVKVLSNRFSYSSSYSGFDNRVYMGNSTLLFSRPKKSNNEYITTVDEWKTYIASNELYVDYQLNTPTDLQCTEEQITALEAFIKARTYKGITYIYDEDEVEAVVDMIYFKDLEMAINNITNAVVSLGGNV